MRQERMEDRDDLWEYRAGWRQWFYAAVIQVSATQIPGTLTLRDAELGGKTIEQQNAPFMARLLDHRSTDLDGIFVFEFSHRGTKRVHCHFLASSGSAVSGLLDRWAGLGWTDVRPTSDLLGAVAYITKAFGPETVWRAFGEHESWLTSQSGLAGGLLPALSAAGAAPATSADARGIGRQTATQRRMSTEGH